MHEGERRLGPQRETAEESAARAHALAEKLIAATKAAAPEPPPVDRSNLCTTNGKPVDQVRADQTNETGQHDGYIVLCAEERAKGFVRWYRDAYQHVGPKAPKYPLRDLTDDERARFAAIGYVKFEAYPEGSPERPTGSSVVGAYWTQQRIDAAGRGCRSITSMGRALSETYARDPKFYGATFCAGCNRHLPVDEFVWTADGERVGS
jgi:hypothetical protein